MGAPPRSACRNSRCIHARTARQTRFALAHGGWSASGICWGPGGRSGHALSHCLTSRPNVPRGRRSICSSSSLSAAAEAGRDRLLSAATARGALGFVAATLACALTAECRLLSAASSACADALIANAAFASAPACTADGPTAAVGGSRVGAAELGVRLRGRDTARTLQHAPTAVGWAAVHTAAVHAMRRRSM